MSQITKNILMIRPLSFGFNNDTSNDNYFQKNQKLYQFQYLQFRRVDEEVSDV